MQLRAVESPQWGDQFESLVLERLLMNKSSFSPGKEVKKNILFKIAMYRHTHRECHSSLLCVCYNLVYLSRFYLNLKFCLYS